MIEPIRGWKVFDENLQCRGYQFEVGKSYEVEGAVKMCTNGFHFHHNGGDLFRYYDNTTKNRVCEVLAHDAISQDDKSVCKRIEVIRELDYNEVCLVYSDGISGSGYGDGYGDGDGSGSGSGSGSGYGYGSGSGYGDGYGDGDGSGSGSGDGYGDGDGSGSGSGYGYGDGYGSGSGSGYGSGQYQKIQVQKF